MELEILPFDLETALQKAIKDGGSNSYEVLEEFAKRYPDAKMTRKNSDGTIQEFTGYDVACCAEQFGEFRP